MKTNTEIANELYHAWNELKAIGPIAHEMETQTVDSAYDIQNQWMQQRISESNPIVGRKIGLTSFKVQEQLGVNQPDFGTLLKDFELRNNELLLHQLIQGKAEAEIAVVLKKSIEEKNANWQQLIDSIEYVAPCIEVVDSRIENWKISIYDTIADNASSAFFVIGNEKVAPEKVDWKNAKMNMWAEGNLVSIGEAALCLGDPLASLSWLANTMIDLNQPLQKGEIILTGALGPMHTLTQAEHLKAEIESVGTVELQITKP